MWSGGVPRLLSPDRREVLPLMAITSRATISAGAPVSEAIQATKQRWNASASSEARMAPRWSWAGVSSRNGRKRRRSASFLSPEPRHIGDRLGAGEDGQQTQKQDFIEWIKDLGALAKVRQILEKLQENNRFPEHATIRTRDIHPLSTTGALPHLECSRVVARCLI